MKTTSGSSTSTPIPWLSGLLVVLSLVFFVHARLMDERVAAEGTAALESAHAYWLEHPYLDPGTALGVRLDAAEIQRARADFERERLERGWVDIPAGVERRRQEKLDGLVAEALVGLRALPARRVAVVPADGLSLSWLLHPIHHTATLHLLGNGLLILFLGIYLERSLGRATFAVTASLAVASGAALWSTAHPAASHQGLVGGSALAAGLLAAFGVRHARRIHEPFVAVGLVLGSLWLALPPWAGLRWSLAPVDLLSVAPPLPARGVYWALLGAAGCGLVVAFAASLFGIDGTRVEEVGSPATRSPRFRRALRAREAGRPREALELLKEHLREEPDAYEAALLIWDLELELGRPDANAALLRVIRIELKRGLAESAIDHWFALSENGIPADLPLPLIVSMAVVLRERDQQAAAIEALRVALERSDTSDSRLVAARIARAARGLDTEVAELAAWRALGSIEIGLNERQALEKLLGEVLQSKRAPGQPLFAVVSAHRAGETPEAPRPVPIDLDPPQPAPAGADFAGPAPSAPPQPTPAEQVAPVLASRLPIAPRLASLAFGPPASAKLSDDDTQPQHGPPPLARPPAAPLASSPAGPNALRPEPIDIETAERAVDVVSALPLELIEAGIEIQTDDGQKKLLRYERIEALALVAVEELGPKPVILLDLVLNWMTTADETLRVIRMRADRFDPRRLAPASSRVEALRTAVGALLERSSAAALPDEQSALGRPFACFASLADYQHQVLMVDGSRSPRR